MKRALLAATAIITGSFAPVLTTPAFADATQTPTADGENPTTLAAMQTQCDAFAAVHGAATGEGVDHWTDQLVQGDGTLTVGPTEDANTRVIDQSSIVGTGTYVPSHLEIRGNPYKIGGSVNMFGDQWATAGYYPDSTYNYTANFDSTFSYAFNCNVYQAVYHPPVYHPAVHHPAEGSYVVRPSEHGNDDAHQQACTALNDIGNTWPHWGEDTEQCTFDQTQAAYDDPAYTDPAYWDEPVLAETDTGVPVSQNETDSLTGFEPHGGVLQVTGDYFVGQTVICISPGSKGGSWKPQNGYSGGSLAGPAAGCNTPYFKIAPTNAGTTQSQGTFTSVPNYNY